ncbi:MAG TPA: phosphatidate cytidylyltransferase [Chloroflexota bacterium]|nr:phosphatidate cytidylyltransferase [Chloroflexota bacterium]HUM68360.1 phosphatidate cytidylyltransferase [Chloroflexota bacterium]
MFLQRALVALIFGPLALLLIYFGDELGGLVYFVPFAILLALATMEYVQLTRHLGWQVAVWLLLPLVIGQWVLAQWGEPEWVGPSILISMLIMLTAVLYAYEKQSSQTVAVDWMAYMGGFFLLGWLGSHFFLLRGIPHYAWQWTMLAMLTTWIADSGAYVVGKFVAGKYVLGKHKLSPRLSPNKTVEGFFGGVVLGTFFVVLIGYFLQVPFWPLVILGLAITILGPLGDLSISLLKREAGVKDSGNLLPGHGGALDRVDTLLWAVAIAYYLALYLPQLS